MQALIKRSQDWPTQLVAQRLVLAQRLGQRGVAHREQPVVDLRQHKGKRDVVPREVQRARTGNRLARKHGRDRAAGKRYGTPVIAWRTPDPQARKHQRQEKPDPHSSYTVSIALRYGHRPQPKPPSYG